VCGVGISGDKGKCGGNSRGNAVSDLSLRSVCLCLSLSLSLSFLLSFFYLFFCVREYVLQVECCYDAIQCIATIVEHLEAAIDGGLMLLARLSENVSFDTFRRSLLLRSLLISFADLLRCGGVVRERCLQRCVTQIRSLLLTPSVWAVVQGDSDAECALIWLLAELEQHVQESASLLAVLVRDCFDGKMSALAQRELLSATVSMFLKRPDECNATLVSVFEQCLSNNTGGNKEDNNNNNTKTDIAFEVRQQASVYFQWMRTDMNLLLQTSSENDSKSVESQTSSAGLWFRLQRRQRALLMQFDEYT
jgi:hypothetical protein